MAFKQNTVEHTTAGLANKEAAEDLLGTVYTQDILDIIGRSAGASKTTTATYGIAIVEEFGVVDELFVHWNIPSTLDLTAPVLIYMGWAPTTSEVGRTLSLDLQIGTLGPGDIISGAGIEFNIVDEIVPATALESFEITLELSAGFIINTDQDLHIRIRRVASGADPVGNVALHHATVDHYRHQR